MDRIPLRWSGVVLLAFLLGLLRWVTYKSQDLVLLVAGVSLLGLCLLLVLAVCECYWTLGRRLRHWKGEGKGEGRFQLLSGQPYRIPLGFSIPFRPLVEVDWRWIHPEGVGVRVFRDERGWVEEIQFSRRCLVEEVERCIEVRDVLGIASLRRRIKSRLVLEVLPTPQALHEQTLVTSMHAGDEISDPIGEPVGDRVDMRRYASGDPPRFILWKVFARTGKLMVRIPERALAPTPKTCAYLVAGEQDEEAAGVARALLETGVLGSGWRFGADGSGDHAMELKDALTLIARSGNLESRASGLRPYLEQARRDHYQSCLVLVPSSFGPWIGEVEKSMATCAMQVTLLVVGLPEGARPGGGGQRSLWEALPQGDKLVSFLFSPKAEMLGKEPDRVLARFSRSGHPTLVYHPTSRQVLRYFAQAARKGASASA